MAGAIQELLTPSEAAVVASVTVRDVNRVIDERLLPDGLYALEDGRRLHVVACPFIGFYFHGANARSGGSLSTSVPKSGISLSAIGESFPGRPTGPPMMAF
jgi:hypothetical protein